MTEEKKPKKAKKAEPKKAETKKIYNDSNCRFVVGASAAAPRSELVLTEQDAKSEKVKARIAHAIKCGVLVER